MTNALNDKINTEKLTELGLSESDIVKVQTLVENTPITRTGLDNFGSELSSNTAYVDDILTKANSDDLGEIGKKMIEIATIAKSVNLDGFGAKRSKLPIIGRVIDKFALKGESLKLQFANANTQIATIINEVGLVQDTIKQRNNELDEMFEAVTAEHKALGVHIMAGQIKLDEIKSVIAEKQEEFIKSGSNNPLLSQEISDLTFAMASLDKRIGDLSVMQHATQQTMPAIRIIQSNNRLLADKFATVKEITIPAWKNQFMLALTLAEQQSHVEMADMIDKATNDLLKSNAELLHKNAVGASVASQRLAINPETLQEVHQKLIATLDDVIKTQADGEKSRKDAIKKLNELSEQQNQSLLGVRQ